MTPPVEEQFRQAIERAGIVAPANIIADGKLHRFSTNGNGDDAGRYVLHDDDKNPAGWFMDYRSGIEGKWRAQADRQKTAKERTDLHQQIEADRREREAEERQRHADAAALAQRLWDASAAAPADHPYLVMKQIRSHGLRLYRGPLRIMDQPMDGALLVPRYDVSGALCSLQFIMADREKKYLPKGKTRGGFFTIGPVADPKIICIAEGAATAASIYEATGHTTVVAFDAGNLEAVARAMRVKHPEAMILLCGDEDIREDGKPNAGREAATAAAHAIGGGLVMPALDGKKCDFNDVHVERGLAAVRAAVEDALRSRAPHNENREESEAMGPETQTCATNSTTEDKGPVKELADTILATDAFAKDAGGLLCVFEAGAYRPHGEDSIARRVKHILEATGDTKRWSSHRAREVMEYLQIGRAHV